MNLAGGEGARERAVTPAEHGQERWTIYPCGCGAVGGNPSFERAVPCGRRSDGFHDAKPVEVVLADRERALEESAAEFEAKFEQAAAEAETLEAERRALVEAGNNVISDLERQGSVTSAHYNALRAALDRIQEGKP
jgi:hypothetical protein